MEEVSRGRISPPISHSENTKLCSYLYERCENDGPPVFPLSFLITPIPFVSLEVTVKLCTRVLDLFSDGVTPRHARYKRWRRKDTASLNIVGECVSSLRESYCASLAFLRGFPCRSIIGVRMGGRRKTKGGRRKRNRRRERTYLAAVRRRLRDERRAMN